MIRVGLPIKAANGRFADALVAAVALGELSELISKWEMRTPATIFILVGHDNVLADRRMVDP